MPVRVDIKRKPEKSDFRLLPVWPLWRKEQKKESWIARVSDHNTIPRKYQVRLMNNPYAKIAPQSSPFPHWIGPAFIQELCSLFWWKQARGNVALAWKVSVDSESIRQTPQSMKFPSARNLGGALLWLPWSTPSAKSTLFREKDRHEFCGRAYLPEEKLRRRR